MFLELMVVPGSYEDTSGFFKNMVRTPLVVIHNAHEAYGFNAADSSKREENKKMLNESRRFADLFASPIIVVHAGNDFGKAGLEDRRGKRKYEQAPRTELEKAQIEIVQLKHQLQMAQWENRLLKKLAEIERSDALDK